MPEEERATPSISAYELLAGDAGQSYPPDVDLPPELLADLHEQWLVITPDYVGRDRRQSHGALGHDDRNGRTLDRRRQGAATGFRERFMVTLVTVAVVVPLTLMAVHAVGQLSSPRQVAQSLVAGTSAVTTASAQAASDRRARQAARQAARAAQQAARATQRAVNQAARVAQQAAQLTARADQRVAQQAARADQRAARQAARADQRAARQAARPQRHVSQAAAAGSAP